MEKATEPESRAENATTRDGGCVTIPNSLLLRELTDMNDRWSQKSWIQGLVARLFVSGSFVFLGWLMIVSHPIRLAAEPLHPVQGSGPDRDNTEATSVASRVVSYYGYDDCVELSNELVRVVLCPSAGGRVLHYSLAGKNVLYLPPGDEGWLASPKDQRGTMNAGRFDIGPEKVVKRGLVLWSGKWTAKILGDGHVRMTSQVDELSGVRLSRDFVLTAESSQLICTQTIENVSGRDVELCHWSRTFAVGNGIAVVPRSPFPRFPFGYVMYGKQNQLMMRPQDPAITVTQDHVIVQPTPQFPKLGFDSHAGWLAYAAPNDLLFVKRFRTFPKRYYNEVAGLTISIWYPSGKMVELEPIGPAERLSPGQKAEFTEEWFLMEYRFPRSGQTVDVKEITKRAEAL